MADEELSPEELAKRAYPNSPQKWPEAAAAIAASRSPQPAPAPPPPAPSGGAVLGRSAPVPVDQQDPVSKWVSQSAVPAVKQAFSSSEPLFNNPFAAPPGPTTMPEVTVEGQAPPPAKPDLVFAQPQAAPRPVTIPAHNQPLVDPALQQQLMGAYDQQIGSVEERKKAAEGTARERAIGHLDQAITNVKAQEKSLEREGETKGMADKADAELKAYRDRIDKFSQELSETKFDPKKAFSGFDNFRFAVAGMLMGALQGWGKVARNTAVDQANVLMDQELRRQMAEFDAKKGRVNDMENLYAKAYAATKDKQEAYKLAYGYGVEALKHEADALAAKADSRLALSAAEEVKAELSEHQAQVGVAKQTDKVKMNKWVPQQTVGGGAGGAKDKGLVFQGPDGQFYQARNEDSRKKLAEGSANLQDFNSAVNEYESALKKLGVTDKIAGKAGWTTQDAQPAVTAYGKLQDAARKAANMGTPQAAELAIMAQRIPPPDQFSGDPASSLGVLRAGARATFNSAMRAESPLPVMESVGAAGPVKAYTGQHYAPPATQQQAGFTPARGK